jgi:hypothetical protein
MKQERRHPGTLPHIVRLANTQNFDVRGAVVGGSISARKLKDDVVHSLVPAPCVDIGSHKSSEKTHVWARLKNSPEVRRPVLAGQLKAVGSQHAMQMSAA